MDSREYHKQLRKLSKLLENEHLKKTDSYDAIRELSETLERFEELRFPIGLPTPADAIKFRMEQSGFTQTDLARLLNSRPRATEYLNGTRRPSKRDALKIHQEWHVPLKCLIQ